MKDRFVTLAGALFALYLMIIVLVPPSSEQVPQSYPRSNDYGLRGLAGLKNWLDLNGINTVSMRKPYTRLISDEKLNSSGNLLVVALPVFDSRFQPQEISALNDWLANDNSILIVAAVNNGITFDRDFNLRSQDQTKRLLANLDITLNEQEVTASDEVDSETATVGVLGNLRDSSLAELVAATETDLHIGLGQHAALQGVGEISLPRFKGLGKKSSRPYVYPEVTSDDAFLIPLMQSQTASQQGLWYIGVAHSQGSVWLATYSELFANRYLQKSDNAKLVTNLINLSLVSGGAVIFDDFHQGLSELYDKKAFFSDPRLHLSLLAVFLLWLIYTVGFSNRFGPLDTSKQRRSSTDFVKAVGGLLARQISEQQLNQNLLNHFYNDYRKKRTLPSAEISLFSVMKNDPSINNKDLAKLETLALGVSAGNKINTIQLTNHLQKIKNQL